MEIEAGVSQVWWERYLADRAARVRHANERAARSAPNQPTRQYLPIPERRVGYQLGPNGELTRSA